ncbi:MAG: DUF2721 domain-containing protein [Capsulimonadaceae bacterium]
MVSFESNPLTVLSYIAAPAVLTNASSVLALGTSNRFARAVDRARALAHELEGGGCPPERVEGRLSQLDRVEKRSLLLVRALARFYAAVGCFGASSLISLVGGGLTAVGHMTLSRVALVLGLVAGFTGVGTIVHGCVLLLHETRLAVLNLREESARIHAEHLERAKRCTEASQGSAE